MKITPIPHGLEDLIGKSGVRTPGLHMSALYGDLYQDLEPKRYKRDSVPDPLRLEAGLAFEQFLEEALRARFLQGERPPEFTHHEPGILEPILFNPDLIIFNGGHRVGEIKLTWMTSREMPRGPANSFPPKMDKWVTQMMSYCHCLETPYARLFGFFVNGDYDCSRAFSPQLMCWDLEFSKRELDDNWRGLMNHGLNKGLLHAA